MRVWGDEVGMFWDTPVKIKSTVQGEKVPREPLRTPPAPANYKPPDYFPQLSRYKRIVFDLETFDPNLKAMGPGTIRKDGFITGYGIGTEDFAEYYPVGHTTGPNCDKDKVERWLSDELKEFSGEIIGAKLLYDHDWSSTRNICFPKAKIRDVQWAEPLLDENSKSYKLEALARKYLEEGKVTSELKDLYGPEYIRNMHKVHPGHARAYVIGDVTLPLSIYDIQVAEMKKEGVWDLFLMESRLHHMLLYMRQLGVRVDLDAAEQVGKRLNVMRNDANARIRRITGYDIDVWSAQSVARAFDDQGIKYPRTKSTEKNPDGNPSFRKEWLLAHPSELAELVSTVRRCDKFDGNFVQKFTKESINGRIHCQFNPVKADEVGTVSGRFSSSNPNLQQVPVRDDVFGPLIRAMFIPEEGCDWWSNDYSQIEYRLLVHYAVLTKGTKANIAAEMYRNNPETDFHQLAAELTGKPRKQAKNINFGIVYGMGVDHMMEVLGCDRATAINILDEYHSEMPFCRQVYNLASNQAKNNGFVRTILMRKRRFQLWEPNGFWKLENNVWVRTKEKPAPGADRPPGLLKEDALREYGDSIRVAYTHKALNGVLQGGSADMTKKAMGDAWEAGLVGPTAPLHCHLTVHDELDGSGNRREKRTTEAHRELTDIMINAIPLKIPVLVGTGWGANWAEAH